MGKFSHRKSHVPECFIPVWNMFVVVLHVLSGGGIRSAPTHAQSEILPPASLLPHTVAAESGEVPTYLGGR